MQLHKDKFEYVCHVASKTNTLRELPFVNEIYQYSTSKGPLEPVNQLRDLGVIICPDLSWTSHISTICNKSKQKAAWVLSVFHSRSPMVILTLYKSLVRSLLEYCSPLWNPAKVSDIQQLESVQKTFTSRIAGCQDLDYWERLQKLSLMSRSREDVRDSSSSLCGKFYTVRPATTSTSCSRQGLAQEPKLSSRPSAVKALRPTSPAMTPPSL